MNFQKKLRKIQKKNNSLVCVGLDSDIEKIPKHLLKKPDPIFEFNKAIIDATYDLVCAYKPNIAFYEAEGEKGLRSLKRTIDYLHKKSPSTPIILDAKRGDIGNTNLAYIKLIFDYLKADAVTLHPYLGKESLLPFLALKDKFFFILCRTSNPGAGEFQDLKVKGSKLYQYLAKQVVNEWNLNNNCGLVVGATYHEELKIIRKIAGNAVLLIPGVGKQGGDVEKTVQAAESGPFLINSSRSIIFASSGKDFAQAAGEATTNLRDSINKYR
jgi:orotidine-5'-phosphate decarboxylase